LLGQFTEIKGISEAINLLEVNPKIIDLKDVYIELENIDIHPNVKKFITFVLDTAQDIIVNQKVLDINKGMEIFTNRLMNEPEVYFDLLTPFIADKINKEKLAIDMKNMQDKIGENNLSEVRVDLLNIRMDDFKEKSEFAGITPEFQQAEVKVNVSVESFNDRIFSIIDDRFGVASLTTNNNDALMWSHYASSHTGICIEYDFKDYINQLADGQILLFPVNYSENRVTIDQKLMDKIDLKNIEVQGEKDLLKVFFSGLYTKNFVWK
jgi:predicted DNA binding CopG/RHH family protein